MDDDTQAAPAAAPDQPPSAASAPDAPSPAGESFIDQAIDEVETVGEAVLTAVKGAVEAVIPLVVEAASPAISSLIAATMADLGKHIDSNTTTGALVSGMLQTGLTSFANNLLAAGHLPTLK